jgi:uncharacterized protein (DUF58 family)
VRDYVPGDSFNRIHWPSTARNARLIVKEFELDPTAHVWLFLDMEKRVQAGDLRDLTPDLSLPPVLRLLREDSIRIELDPNTEEYAVAITASLAKHFLDRGQGVGLVAYGRGEQREFAQVDRGERQLARLLTTLAVTRAEGSIPLSQVLTAEPVHFTRDTTIIVVTSSTNPDWVVAMRQLAARGVRTTAVVIDPSTFPQEIPLAHSAHQVIADLVASKIPTYPVRYGDSLEVALSEANAQAV